MRNEWPYQDEKQKEAEEQNQYTQYSGGHSAGVGFLRHVRLRLMNAVERLS